MDSRNSEIHEEKSSSDLEFLEDFDKDKKIEHCLSTGIESLSNRQCPLPHSLSTISASSSSKSQKKRAKTNWNPQPTRFHNYLVGDQIGGNQLSKIYAAIHSSDYRPACIKMMSLRKLRQSNLYGKQIFFAESILAPYLVHPHITQVFETVHTETHLVQIMELLECGNLQNILDQYKSDRLELLKIQEEQASKTENQDQNSTIGAQVSDNSMLTNSPEEIAQEGYDPNRVTQEEYIYEEYYGFSHDDKLIIFDQILSAVEYMHAHHICHRDIKLENVILNASMSTVKLCDFGFMAISLPSKGVSGLFGSYGYAAPEVLQNKGFYDGCSADMWSLGVLAYSLFAEKSPFLIEPQQEDQSDEVSGYNKLHKPLNSHSKIKASNSDTATVINSPLFNVSRFFEEAVKNIDYSMIPQQIATIIQRLLVVDPNKRSTCHSIRMDPLFQYIERRVPPRVFNRETTENNSKISIKLKSLSEDEAKKTIVRRIGELLNCPIETVMSKLKLKEPNEEKVLYSLIEELMDLEGYFSSFSSNRYQEPYRSPQNSSTENNDEQLNTTETSLKDDTNAMEKLLQFTPIGDNDDDQQENDNISNIRIDCNTPLTENEIEQPTLNDDDDDVVFDYQCSPLRSLSSEKVTDSPSIDDSNISNSKSVTFSPDVIKPSREQSRLTAQTPPISKVDKRKRNASPLLDSPKSPHSCGHSYSKSYTSSNSLIPSQSVLQAASNSPGGRTPLQSSMSAFNFSSFKSIEEFRSSEIIIVVGDPAEIMIDVDKFLIAHQYTLSYNVVGERTAITTNEDDETSTLTLEMSQNNVGNTFVDYYDIKVVSKDGRKSDIMEVVDYIKTKFEIPTFS